MDNFWEIEIIIFAKYSNLKRTASLIRLEFAQEFYSYTHTSINITQFIEKNIQENETKQIMDHMNDTFANLGSKTIQLCPWANLGSRLVLFGYDKNSFNVSNIGLHIITGDIKWDSSHSRKKNMVFC